MLNCIWHTLDTKKYQWAVNAEKVVWLFYHVGYNVEL